MKFKVQGSRFRVRFKGSTFGSKVQGFGSKFGSGFRVGFKVHFATRHGAL
jgi:hypothetical protein